MLAASTLFPMFWQRFVFCEHQNSMFCKTVGFSVALKYWIFGQTYRKCACTSSQPAL